VTLQTHRRHGVSNRGEGDDIEVGYVRTAPSVGTARHEGTREAELGGLAQALL
jgi:hypothetical protein